jgi:hypothetical protein
VDWEEKELEGIPRIMVFQILVDDPYGSGLDYAKLQTVRDATGVMSQFGEPFGPFTCLCAGSVNRLLVRNG